MTTEERIDKYLGEAKKISTIELSKKMRQFQINIRKEVDKFAQLLLTFEKQSGIDMARSIDRLDVFRGKALDNMLLRIERKINE